MPAVQGRVIDYNVTFTPDMTHASRAAGPVLQDCFESGLSCERGVFFAPRSAQAVVWHIYCLLYTSDAADDM
eukprot:3240844-Rhodomonas_salina.1